MFQNENTYNTKAKIQNTVLELLKECSIENLTVKQISEKAFISRVHFYNYFLDKYDVLETLEKEFLVIFKEILGENRTYLKQHGNLSNDELYQLLYKNALKNMNHFIANQELIICMLSENGDPTFMERLHEIYRTHFHESLPTIALAKNTKYEVQTTITFITNGIASILEEWIASSFKLSSEVIAKNMIDLILASLQVIY